MTVLDGFRAAVSVPDAEIDLARAALLIAAERYPEMDLERQFRLLNSLAAGAATLLGTDREPLHDSNILSQYLFEELAFRGNSEDYYDPRNSYLNQVLERRLGIPITLSLLYIEVGRRLDVPLVGIGMPGHFLVRHRDVPDLFIDPFYGGMLLSIEECERRAGEVGAALQWRRGYLEPVDNRSFLARMLRNLKAIYVRQQRGQEALAVLDFLVALLPEDRDERRDRETVLRHMGG